MKTHPKTFLVLNLIVITVFVIIFNIKLKYKLLIRFPSFHINTVLIYEFQLRTSLLHSVDIWFSQIN